MAETQKKTVESKEEGLPIWMATFADMMTLLFAFFVLLFSMSTIDPVKVSAMQDAMEENTTAIGGASTAQSTKPLSVSEIKETLESIIEDSEVLKKGATVSSDPRGVVLELDGKFCFDVLSADIQHAFLELLVEIKEKVMSHPHDQRTVIIEGHSDNVPIPKTNYKNTNIPVKEVWPTNRHLSGARAAAVVNALTEDGFCLPEGDISNKSLLEINNRDNDTKTYDINTQNCAGVNELWFEMGVKANRLVSAGYGEFWPFGEEWSNVKAKHFGDDKCFVVDSDQASTTKYLGGESIPLTIIQNFKEVNQQECLAQNGYWGNEIDFLNATGTQQEQNRRVKIIFSKN